MAVETAAEEEDEETEDEPEEEEEEEGTEEEGTEEVTEAEGAETGTADCVWDVSLLAACDAWGACGALSSKEEGFLVEVERADSAWRVADAGDSTTI